MFAAEKWRSRGRARRAGWAIGGRVRSAFLFTIEHERISAIDIVMDPAQLAELEVAIA